jgi:hypothetical protein
MVEMERKIGDLQRLQEWMDQEYDAPRGAIVVIALAGGKACAGRDHDPWPEARMLIAHSTMRQ